MRSFLYSYLCGSGWPRGARGERLTARALYPLRRSGAVVLHDVADGTEAGNVDHIVVSHGGVFLLDSKFLVGDIDITDDSVIVRRPDDESETYRLDRVAPTVRARAARLKQDIETHAGLRVRVHALVVLWPCLAAEIVQAEAVVFISGDQLASCLRDRRPVMSEETITRVAAAIYRARPPRRSAWRGRQPMLAPSAVRASASSGSRQEKLLAAARQR